MLVSDIDMMVTSCTLNFVRSRCHHAGNGSLRVDASLRCHNIGGGIFNSIAVNKKVCTVPEDTLQNLPHLKNGLFNVSTLLTIDFLTKVLMMQPKLSNQRVTRQST